MANIRDRTSYVVRVYSGPKRAGKPLQKKTLRSEAEACAWLAREGYPSDHVTITRGTERWRVDVRRGGNAIRRTYASEALAREAAERLEAEVLDPVQAARQQASHDTVRDLLDRYEREHLRWKPSYQNDGKARINVLRAHPMASLRITQIDQSVVEAYARERQGLADPHRKRPWNIPPEYAPRAPIDGASVKREKSILSGAFRQYGKQYGLTHNPCHGVTVPATKVVRDHRGQTSIVAATKRRDADESDELAASRSRRLRGDEEAQLLAQLRRYKPRAWIAPYGEPFMVLAIETAARRSELLRLRWDDIDLDRAIARIGPSKRADEARAIPLSPKAESVLRALHSRPERDPNELRVLPITIEQVRRMWRICRKQAGIVDLRVHDLRHEATSRLFEIGLDTTQVMRITRHDDLASLSRYTHLRADDLVTLLRGGDDKCCPYCRRVLPARYHASTAAAGR